MSNYTNIYKKVNNKVELLDTLNYTLKEFQKNPRGCYPAWNSSSMVASDIKYEYPVIDENTQELREKTREELILTENKVELLQEGEYIEDEKIITVPAPENLIKKLWNKENHSWTEGMTKEELVKMRTKKILKYSELEESKKALEGSKFSSEDEITLINQEMLELEKDINKLATKISYLSQLKSEKYNYL